MEDRGKGKAREEDGVLKVRVKGRGVGEEGQRERELIGGIKERRKNEMKEEKKRKREG